MSRPTSREQSIILDIYGLQDEELKAYCKQVGVDIEKLKQHQGMILVNAPVKDAYKTKHIDWLKVAKGSHLSDGI